MTRTGAPGGDLGAQVAHALGGGQEADRADDDNHEGAQRVGAQESGEGADRWAVDDARRENDA